MAFCNQKSDYSTRIPSLYGSPALICGFVQDSQQRLVLWVPALTGGFCMQNSDFRTRITSPYGFQTSPMAFACKTATLAPELLVSMSSDLTCRFVHAKHRD